MKGSIIGILLFFQCAVTAQTTWDKKQDVSIKDLYKGRDSANAQTKRLFAADIIHATQITAIQKQAKSQNDSTIKIQKQIKALQAQNDSLIKAMVGLMSFMDSSQFFKNSKNVISLKRYNEIIDRLTKLDGKQ